MVEQWVGVAIPGSPASHYVSHGKEGVMSALTKCDTLYCPSAGVCWRKQAPAKHDGFQSYQHFTLPPGAVRCESFWPFVAADAVEEIRRCREMNLTRDDEVVPLLGGVS
jgi:hypothetical protein